MPLMTGEADLIEDSEESDEEYERVVAYEEEIMGEDDT